MVASLPFAPEVVLPTVHHFVTTLQLHDQHRYGFKASFNPTWGDPAGSVATCGWVSPYCFGLNVGPILLMIENHRSGMLWELLHGCRWIVDGLTRAGFEGGWLGEHGKTRS